MGALSEGTVGPDPDVLPTANQAVNLGCGRRARDGYTNVDYVPAVHVDQVVDLEQIPWPWPDNAWHRVRIHNTLEHLRPLAQVVRELHRITKPGGLIDILVPHKDSPSACQVDHWHLFDKHSLIPHYRGGDGSPGLDVDHLFDLIDLTVTHRHPFAWHQRYYLGREILAWGPHQVRWILRPRDTPHSQPQTDPQPTGVHR